MSAFVIGVTNNTEISLSANMLNRHGLVAGATGTGKTVTMQVLAEQLSKLGTSVLITDIKGDVSGIAKPMVVSDRLNERLNLFSSLNYTPKGSPVNFIDVFGEKGHPLRVTPTTMGPLLLSRLLDLNETQEGILHIAFKYADEEGLLILDLKDLQSLLRAMGDNIAVIKTQYGNVTPASIGAIQRRLLVLEEQGANIFFGEPEFQVKDLLLKDFNGSGIIHLLDSTRLFNSPRLYASILLWILSELFEELEEVGDQEAPRLALFFDEAHLLFKDLPKHLGEKIETVVRLIRSKGVGVFFVTQSPSDVPQGVLGQLGTKIQHALRAYTPQDQAAIRQIAKTFRTNPEINIESSLTSLKVGEALVSGLSERGEPLPVEQLIIRPPESQIGPLTESERDNIISRSMLKSKYEVMIDRESAYEVLMKRAEDSAAASEEAAEKKTSSKSSSKPGPFAAFFTSLARSVGTQVGKQIMRGVLGTLKIK